MAYKGFIIVESPAKAKTLNKYVGNDYKVMASKGHVIDLPKNRIGIDVAKDFTPKYVVISGKEKTIKELKDVVAQSDAVYLATDPDREGEAIAWHLARALNIPEDSANRIELHEITPDAFKKALDNPRHIDCERVNAQQARRILDRLVGYNLSPVLWKKVASGLSAGRVQSVAVRLVVERQQEIDAFVSEEYWSVAAVLRCLDGNYAPFTAKLLKYKNRKLEITNEEQARTIEAFIKSNPVFVAGDPEKKKQKKEPPAPYITSTLQQDASRRLNFKVTKTMKVAQELFEGLDIGEEGTVGLITYMRTDSTRTADSARQEVAEFIARVFGDDYVGPVRIYKKATGAQEAHECVRPTNVFRSVENLKKYLTSDQFRLYSLIRDRFIASHMASCELNVVTLNIKCGDYRFSSNGSSVVFPGFTKLYNEVKEETEGNEPANVIPPVKAGDELRKEEIQVKQHFTQPPPQYTEATLVKALEKNGIGRPSTYAPIVDTIQKREYVKLTDKKFIPTKLGNVVTDLLVKNFPDIVDVHFTAQVEGELDKIEDGKQDWVSVLREFYEPFNTRLHTVEKEIVKVDSSSIAEETGEMCEKCGQPMIIKRGPYGKFFACSGYPQCKNTKPYTEKIGVACPREGCGGTIIQRRGKKSVFYGCDKYPECDFTSWYRPLDKKCPYCNSLMVLKYSKSNRPYTQCINECRKQQKESEGGNPEVQAAAGEKEKTETTGEN